MQSAISFFTNSVCPMPMLCVYEWIYRHIFDVWGIILVFLTLSPLQNSKGNPSEGALNVRGWKNLANIAIYLENSTR